MWRPFRPKRTPLSVVIELVEGFERGTVRFPWPESQPELEPSAATARIPEEAPTASDARGVDLPTNFGPFVRSLLLLAFGSVLLLLGWSHDGSVLSCLGAGVCLLAYGLFTNWVWIQAPTGRGPIRFLEEVRRAIVSRAPSRPK